MNTLIHTLIHPRCEHAVAPALLSLTCLAVTLPVFGTLHAAEVAPGVHRWSFEVRDDISILGHAAESAGVAGKALTLDGRSVIVAKDAEGLTASPNGFTMTAWINVYGLRRGQQMIVAKNRYALDERQWGVMIDRDDRLRLYVRQAGWRTAGSSVVPQPGRWYHIVVVVEPKRAMLYVNGKPSGEVLLDQPLPSTKAPLTFGGVNDNGRIWQNFWGAIDEVQVFEKPQTASAIERAFKPVDRIHDIPRVPPGLHELWDADLAVPAAQDLAPLDGVEFHVIKPRVVQSDGYNWLHGIALVWHREKLYASFGHNKGAENTASEEARGRISLNGGKTWGELFTIDVGDEPNLAVSHGVFLSHAGRLWAFHGAFRGRLDGVHTRAYRLDESTGRWQKKGVIAERGFWPCQQPQEMDDGNWIMAGMSAQNGYGGTDDPAAVAISHGDDFTTWDLVVIPKPPTLVMWGESAVVVEGRRITNVARYGARAEALVATSDDFGRTWTTSTPTNLPMAGSKPYVGTLSTGQRYLICTTTANTAHRRSPLTIAVSRPGEATLSRIFRIRDALHDGPGESHAQARLAYPYAVERDGKLYVAYSNCGGRGGNRNSAELAIIPVPSLAFAD